MGTTQPVSMEIRDESRVVVNSVIESVWYSLFYLKQDYLLQRLLFYEKISCARLSFKTKIVTFIYCLR